MAAAAVLCRLLAAMVSAAGIRRQRAERVAILDGRSMDVIARVLIRGRVQGVGFRAWTEVTALELGVQGWVRNRRDGSVEALLAGSEEVVLTMIELCRQGPPGACVAAVDQEEAGAADLALRRRGELFSVLATS